MGEVIDCRSIGYLEVIMSKNDLEVELTILMPCLNEEETLETCIKKAKCFLDDSGIVGEILIADNGSTDHSVQIAEKQNARVITVLEKGYGAALNAGCEAARGKYVIMGDADDSYDFLHLMPFVEKLRSGYDLVMGNRFTGGIAKGAMPWSHRYIGNPVLSFIGRLFFSSKIRDFHCGLRGYNRASISSLNLHTTGMEYASEMVVKAELNELKICEIPTTLQKDGRSRPPHLQSLKDGWRHLKFLFMYSPNWLFLYPGIIMIVLSACIGLNLIIQQIRFNDIVFSIHTLLYFATFLMIGVNMVLFFIMTKTYAAYNHFLPINENNLIYRLNEEWFLLMGGVILLAGIVSTIFAFIYWSDGGFSELEPEVMMRWVVPAAAALEIGIMFLLSGFLIGIFKVGHK